MAYFIVNPKTGEMHKKFHWASAEVYDTERGAKTACTKLNKKSIQKTSTAPWEVWETEEWNTFKAIKFPVKMVKRVNMMSGKEYWEAEDTPNYCSPASESYWSM